MTASDLFCIISDLTPFASNSFEESRRLTLEGLTLNPSIRKMLDRVIEIAEILDITNSIVVLAGNQNIGHNDLSDTMYDGEIWRLIIAKTPLAKPMKAREDEDTLFFFSIAGFHQWLETVDPFTYPSAQDPDFANPTTIRVYGLQNGFGGDLLWVLPINAPTPVIPIVSLPSISDVHGLIHVNAVDKSLRVCPIGFALTWGIEDDPTPDPLIKLSAQVLSSCLVQELKQVDGKYEAILRGTKRVSMLLTKPEESVNKITLTNLIESVSWVYEERPETRLKLVMDRLSIESQVEDTLLFCMQEYLDAALQQARDSYAFVILERKDAYHKEMRELMKDMKTQADLYATKVRDLVSSLTRDILGVLVFIGYSFIGKFDQKSLQPLLVSHELSLLVKFLAGYLILSCILQLIMHWRDANLAYKESQKWLDTLQNYTSRKDKADNFISLLDKRKETLYLAMWISGCLYAILSFVIWHLPCLAQRLLAL